MDSNRAATIAHIMPFVAFMAFIAVERVLPLSTEVMYPIRFLVVSLILLILSRPYIQLRPCAPIASLGMGLAVFLIWIGPDALFGYRHSWLFENVLTGRAVSSVPVAWRSNGWFAALRIASSAIVVPIFEELFWRSWLMRWLVKPNFLGVPFGYYLRPAFWTVALLFAAEHGPYWEVGLAAGILYNWWAVRTQSLADCILAHAVTNALLSAYVLTSGRWEYWL